MKQVEDFILLLLWGIACSGIITGVLLGDRFVFGVLGMTGKPQGFPEYTVLIASIILIFLLILYHIVSRMKGHKVRTEISPVIMKDMPFETVEFRASNWKVTVHIIFVLLLFAAVYNIFLIFYPLDPLFDGLFSLKIENLHAERSSCIKRAIFCLLCLGVMYWDYIHEKYCVLEKGFQYKTAIRGHGSYIRQIMIPWAKTENVSIHAVPKLFGSYLCSITLHGKTPLYFTERGRTDQQITYDIGYISRSELEKAKDAISRRVPVEYTEEI